MNLETTIDRLTAQAAIALSQSKIFTSCSTQERGDLKVDFERAAVCCREDAGEMLSAINHLRPMLHVYSKLMSFAHEDDAAT